MTILTELTPLLRAVQRVILDFQPQPGTETTEEAHAFEYLVATVDWFVHLIDDTDRQGCQWFPDIEKSLLSLLTEIKESAEKYKRDSPFQRIWKLKSRRAHLLRLRRQLNDYITDYIVASAWRIHATVYKESHHRGPPVHSEVISRKGPGWQSMVRDYEERDRRQRQAAVMLSRLNNSSSPLFVSRPETPHDEDIGLPTQSKTTAVQPQTQGKQLATWAHDNITKAASRFNVRRTTSDSNISV